MTAAAVVPAVAQSSSSTVGVLEGAVSGVRTGGPESLLLTSAAGGTASLLSTAANAADLFIMAPKNLFLEDPKNMGRSPSSAFNLFMFSTFRMRRFSFSPSQLKDVTS